MAISKADEAYMNQAAAIRLRAELADSRGKVAELERDLAEQCRLLGMGSSREARLMAQLAESQARELRLREALGDLRSGDGDPWCAEQQADSALALPFDDSALREMIEAAKAEERERVFGAIEQAWYAQGLDVRGASISDFLSAIRARNPEKPSGLSERVMTVFAQMQAVSHGRARKG